MIENIIPFLKFSDAAKYADVARNLLLNNSFNSFFNFWGSNNANWIQPVTPYSIILFFKLFGINDFAIIATSFFYFVLSLVFVFLLTQKIYK